MAGFPVTTGGLPRGVLLADSYGADPLGVRDSTAALNAAIAALPTSQISNGVSSFATPVGEIWLGAGDYIINGSTQLSPFGPRVTLRGLGGTTIHDANTNFFQQNNCTTFATTVAAGSNGGNIANIAAWANPSAGVLDVASTTGFPSSGQATVDTSSGQGSARIAYTGIAAGQLTGCTLISGTGTVSTGGSVGLCTITTSGNFVTAGFQPGMWLGGNNTDPGTQILTVTTSAITVNPGVTASSSGLIMTAFLYSINATNPNGAPGGSPWVSGTQWWKGGLRDLFIDGANATAGVPCIAIGGGQDALIHDVTIQNYPGAPSVGELDISNGGMGLTVVSLGVGWNEGWKFRLSAINCLQSVAFIGNKTDNFNSQSQGILDLHTFCLPGQTGLLVCNGAGIYHSKIHIHGDFLRGTASAAGRVLNVRDNASTLLSTELTFECEADQNFGDAGTTTPQTLKLDDSGGASILNCYGHMDFRVGGTTFTAAGRTGGAWPPAGSAFSFWGTIAGDANMAPGGTPAFASYSAGGPGPILLGT